MLDIQCSQAVKASSSFVERRRKRGEDNVDWFQRHYPSDTDETLLILLGGVDPLSLKIRMAQSAVRQNATPSHWSHIAMLRNPAKTFGRTTLLEIRLDPDSGFQFPPQTNAVQEGRLDEYRDVDRFPNVALLDVPVSRRKVLDAVRRFRMLRNVVNGVDLLTAWLPYVWGATGATNPLLQGIGLPSAVLLEHVLAASHFDLTPGLASRASCPEAIWQTAKWWHEFFEHTTVDSQLTHDQRPIRGQWVASNPLCG